MTPRWHLAVFGLLWCTIGIASGCVSTASVRIQYARPPELPLLAYDTIDLELGSLGQAGSTAEDARLRAQMALLESALGRELAQRGVDVTSAAARGPLATETTAPRRAARLLMRGSVADTTRSEWINRPYTTCGLGTCWTTARSFTVEIPRRVFTVQYDLIDDGTHQRVSAGLLTVIAESTSAEPGLIGQAGSQLLAALMARTARAPVVETYRVEEPTAEGLKSVFAQIRARNIQGARDTLEVITHTAAFRSWPEADRASSLLWLALLRRAHTENVNDKSSTETWVRSVESAYRGAFRAGANITSSYQAFARERDTRRSELALLELLERSAMYPREAPPATFGTSLDAPPILSPPAPGPEVTEPVVPSGAPLDPLP